ncbi:MAG: GTP 3',8-cyclase MoaA [Deltaproteobacteria bacterium]|nr:GTP 3',8-cyclase MoaA [Deltaproteobacteria bacterium]MBW2176073.1 GTP 3',8-cyclase MoaA [Deltaproteobacteria bacterium]MBW2297490.1 GTP 3',8-cyclase MoaA [Deltaproteobacteria bacterium]
MENTLLTDKFNRQLEYLRISVTDRCNLRCIYCVPKGIVPKVPHDDILRYEEILRIVNIGVALGIRKVRVTGGEPLVRRGIDAFLKSLGDIDGLTDISLTTNGYLLEKNVDMIKSAGIRRINVSIDTLDKDKFTYITGYDVFDSVWRGIMRAYDSGLAPIKLNVVALKGHNDQELVDMARLSLTYPFHIRFIEYMPIGNSRMHAGDSLLAPEIKKRIETMGKLVPVKKNHMDGPAERFRFEGAPGEIGFIRPMSRHFCSECNRLRLTADGHIRPCLLSDRQVDVKGPMRKGCSDDQIANMFKTAVRHKQGEHDYGPDSAFKVTDQMSGIGG